MYYSIDNLSKLNEDELKKTIAQIPQKAKRLEIYIKDDSLQSLGKLKHCLPKILPNIDELLLNGPLLTKELVQLLSVPFSTMPRTVTTLHLNFFKVNPKIGNALVSALANLSTYVTTLKLTFNDGDCAKKSSARSKLLMTILAGLPPNLNTLYLSGSLLDRNAADLIEACAVIPNNITTLQFDEYFFNHQSPSQLALIFKNFPSHITTVNLGEDAFARRSPAEVKTILDALPNTVVNICYDLRGMISRDSAQTSATSLHGFSRFCLFTHTDKPLTALQESVLEQIENERSYSQIWCMTV